MGQEDGDEVVKWSSRIGFGGDLRRWSGLEFLRKVLNIMSSSYRLLQIGQFAFLHGICLVQLLEALSWGFNARRATSSLVSVILETDIEVSSWGFNAGRATSSSVSVILLTARYKC